MNPSDAGGDPTTFDWWSNIWIPFAGIVVAVMIPVALLYGQRFLDRRQMQQNQVRAEQEQAAERRRRATRDAIAELAAFHGLDPLNSPVWPRLASLWSALLALDDEFPADHPIHDLISTQNILGRVTQSAIESERNQLRRASVSAEERRMAVAPLYGWADHFIRDLRAVQAGASHEEIVRRTAIAQGKLDSLDEKRERGRTSVPSIREIPHD